MKDEAKRRIIVGDHVLKGQENYENWSALVKEYLTGKNMWDVVDDTTSKRKRRTDTEAWKKKDATALHAIKISCHQTMQSHIERTDNAKDAWNTLAKMCQPPVSDEKDAPIPADDSPNRQDVLELMNFIKRSNWEETIRLLGRKPYLIHAQVVEWTGGRPLHLAITVGNLRMIEKLLDYMSEEDVKIKDKDGRTALQYAAWYPGNKELFTIADRLIRKNMELLTTPDKLQYIPLNYACLSGNKDMSLYLYHMTTQAFLSSPPNRAQAVPLLLQAVGSKFFDLALDLLKRYPDLAVTNYVDYRGKNRGNAVLALSSQPSAFLSSSGLSFWQRSIYSCLKAKQLSTDIEARINTHVEEVQEDFVMQVKRKLLGLRSNLLEFFGIKQMYDLKQNHVSALGLLQLMSKTIVGLDAKQIRQNKVFDAIFNASRLGMKEFVVEIIKNNPDLLEIRGGDLRSIFHLAVVHRQEKVFSLIYGLDFMQYNFPIYLDKEGNNMLHLAGLLEPKSQLKLDQISGAAQQMQRELQWFKEVERIIPQSYKHYRNKKGETPYQAFDRSHADLLKSGEKWMKDIAQSSTIIGTLIITIMFAALFTAPGGNNQDTGIPLLLNKKHFKLFVISDAISLFASSTSVLTFVGILTSRYSRDDFLISLPGKLIIGLSALFISIAAMMVAFCSTVIIMVKGQLEIVIPIVLLAAIPVCLFVWLEFPLLFNTIKSTYRPGIFDRKMKKWL